LIDLALIKGKVSIPDDHPAPKRGGEGIEGEEVMSREKERRKAGYERTGRAKRMTRASTQGKQCV
jgi:hypothetical protein